MSQNPDDECYFIELSQSDDEEASSDCISAPKSVEIHTSDAITSTNLKNLLTHPISQNIVSALDSVSNNFSNEFSLANRSKRNRSIDEASENEFNTFLNQNLRREKLKISLDEFRKEENSDRKTPESDCSSEDDKSDPIFEEHKLDDEVEPETEFQIREKRSASQQFETLTSTCISDASSGSSKNTNIIRPPSRPPKHLSNYLSTLDTHHKTSAKHTSSNHFNFDMQDQKIENDLETNKNESSSEEEDKNSSSDSDEDLGSTAIHIVHLRNPNRRKIINPIIINQARL